MSGLESLYQELILEHSKRPHGKTLGRAPASRGSGAEPQKVRAPASRGSGAEPQKDAEDSHTATSHQRNPICGDEVTLRVRLDDAGVIRDVTWDGSGCSISQASASMLAVLVEDREDGMPRAEASALIDGFREAMRSRGTIQIDEGTYGDAEALSGVSKYTARVKCAMLAWVALEDALAQTP